MTEQLTIVDQRPGLLELLEEQQLISTKKNVC